jgi:hypothetical protein
MIRILSLSTKGGVGKSSLAQQVGATYLLKKEGAAILVELDDQNLDSQWLKKSKIETRQIEVDGDAKMAILDVFEAMTGKSFVLDVGNQTAEKAVEAMGRSRLLGRFDLILVPVRDVGQDLINCQRTIEEIRRYEPNAKIAMVLNGVVVRRASRLRMLYGRVFDYADEQGLPLLQMPFVEGYGQSREFEKTLFEIAGEADKLIDFFSTKAFEYDKAGKAKEGRDCLAMIEVVTIAVEAKEKVDEIHVAMEALIEGSRDE